MIDEVKFQELKDAAAHAKHNGGRVSVEWDVLEFLLNVWQSANTPANVVPPEPAPEQPAEIAAAVPEPSAPKPKTVVAEATPEAEAPAVTPKPTVQ